MNEVGWIIIDFDACDLVTTRIYDTKEEAREDADELDNTAVIRIEW